MTMAYSEYYEEKGREQGQRQLLQMWLEQRFGPLSPAVRERLESLSEEGRIQLARNLCHAECLRDLGLEG